MEPDAWSLLPPLIPVAIIVPILRTCRWRTASLLAFVFGAFTAASAFLPWHEMEQHIEGAPYWRFEHGIWRGVDHSWVGVLVVMLGSMCSACAWAAGARAQPRSLARTKGFGLLAALVASAAAALTLLDLYFHDEVFKHGVGSSWTTRDAPGGILVALSATFLASCAAWALYRKLLSEVCRRKGTLDVVDPRTLGRVFD